MRKSENDTQKKKDNVENASENDAQKKKNNVGNTPETVPKKLGRKPIVKANKEPKILKKRGRKPKIKKEPNVPKVPRKRGRKPKTKTFSVVKNEKPFDLTTINEKIILHLPIYKKDICDEDTVVFKNIFTERENILKKIKDKPPRNQIKNKRFINFTESDDDLLESLTNTNKMIISEINKRDKTVDESEDNERVIEILSGFIKLTDKKEWPTNTEIPCWWCRLTYKSVPRCYPIKKVNKIYHVHGCFCSFNCAFAYIIDNCINKTWEKISLLQSLYRDMTGEDKVLVAALPWKVLKKNGGDMTEEEYKRDFEKSDRSFRVVEPPMISIITKIEIRKKERAEDNKNKHIPLDSRRVKRAKDNLRIKREIPLVRNRSSFIQSMKLKTVYCDK
jgi:hypothetical protein